MEITLRKAIDAQIQVTEVVREKGLDSFVKKIAAEIDKAAGEGKPECHVVCNNTDEIILDLAIDILKQAGYDTLLNYNEHTLLIHWGYVKI